MREDECEVRRYALSADVTVSLTIEVQAKTEKEAIRLAQEASMQSLCWSCASSEEGGVWRLSGELDGEAENLEVFESGPE